MLEIFFCL